LEHLNNGEHVLKAGFCVTVPEEHDDEDDDDEEEEDEDERQQAFPSSFLVDETSVRAA
jgi:Ran GTPase-activating protein (RanGAP) involved in mRNA processing and transport